MVALGYERYGAQGGDWGAAVTTRIGAQDLGHCAGIHVNMPVAGPGPRRPGDSEPRRSRWPSSSTTSDRLGLLQAAEHPAADPGLRPRRLAGRAGGVDPGEVLGVDRQRRPSRGRRQPRRAARQRDVLLAERQRGVVGPALLGELQRLRRRDVSIPTGVSSSRRRSSPPPRGLGRALLHRHPLLERARPGRPLRRVRRARPLRRRDPGRLPRAQVGVGAGHLNAEARHPVEHRTSRPNHAGCPGRAGVEGIDAATSGPEDAERCPDRPSGRAWYPPQVMLVTANGRDPYLPPDCHSVRWARVHRINRR